MGWYGVCTIELSPRNSGNPDLVCNNIYALFAMMKNIEAKYNLNKTKRQQQSTHQKIKHTVT